MLFLTSWFGDCQGNKEQPLCEIPVVTSAKEEERLIQTSSKASFESTRAGNGTCETLRFTCSPALLKPVLSHLQPVVKLVYNRSNNKYSYTRYKRALRGRRRRYLHLLSFYK